MNLRALLAQLPAALMAALLPMRVSRAVAAQERSMTLSGMPTASFDDLIHLTALLIGPPTTRRNDDGSVTHTWSRGSTHPLFAETPTSACPRCGSRFAPHPEPWRADHYVCWSCVPAELFAFDAIAIHPDDRASAHGDRHV